jgi:hypothetical protein
MACWNADEKQVRDTLGNGASPATSVDGGGAGANDGSAPLGDGGLPLATEDATVDATSDTRNDASLDGDGAPSSSPDAITDAMSGSSDARPDTGVVFDAGAWDASCAVDVMSHPLLSPSNHVDVGTAVAYNSMPPSSGPHYGAWAEYKTYNETVDDRYLVHNLEHGAVVIWHKCATPGTCGAAVTAIEQVLTSIPSDPTCAAPYRLRVVVVPSPTLDVPVAAAAWGWTYKAQCVDAPSLKTFVQGRLRQGPEDTCAPGNIFRP